MKAIDGIKELPPNANAKANVAVQAI